MLSVGLDVGTTSTQMVVSRLRVRNKASGFAVPDMEITDREILYQSPVHFTPLLDESHVDGKALETLILEEYRRAGITRDRVDTGAVIVTGETSRKENAQAVTETLSRLSGDFVVTTAGPDLESSLAARGSGAVGYSRETGKTLLHMDIGGGTANLALIRKGNIEATGCLNVGGRLVKFAPDGERIYVSPVLEGLWQGGSTEELTRRLAKVLEAAAGLGEDPWLKPLTTSGTARLPLNAPGERVIPSFSGGVADCIRADYPPRAFGDMGPELGRAIRESKLCRGEYYLGEHTIRATVIGAGCHSALLSGSTVFCQNGRLPKQNLTVIRLTEEQQERIGDCLPQRISAVEGPWVLALPGYAAPDYQTVAALADRLFPFAKRGPMHICLEADMAKALGQALALRVGQYAEIVCIDRVKLSENQYLDIGLPQGPAFPVVVKTLVFGA